MATQYLSEQMYRYVAMDAAKQLGYGDEVVARIRAAKNDNEVERIMTTERKRRIEADLYY
jgi:hypothetical protein